MSNPVRTALLALCLALCACSRTPPTPSASAANQTPAEAVLTSITHFLAARSFHASVRMDGPQPQHMELDFVAPDRYRVQMPQGSSIIIGDTLYLGDADKKGKTLPQLGKQFAQWRDPLLLDGHDDELKVEALGEDSLDGQPARKYRVRHANVEQEGILYWISRDGLPLRIVRTGQTPPQAATVTVTLDYSRFNDPTLVITPP
jgi:hypothetical protein